MHGFRYRRALALLVALLPFAAVAQDSTAVLTWAHDGLNVASFRVYYGRSPTELTGMQTVSDPTLRTVNVDGLAAAQWYFAMTAVGPTAVESSQSNLACAVIPAGSCFPPLEIPGPVRNLEVTVLTPAAVTVTLSSFDSNSEFDLAIAGSGQVTIALAGAMLFDWCSPRGLSGLPTVTPTSPSLGTVNNDGNRQQTVTFTAPVTTRCDGDSAQGTSAAFTGATVTVQGLSKPLVQSGGTWAVQFP